MRHYQRPTPELRKLFNAEWRRAKKILDPLLNQKDKPRLYTAKSLGRGWLGMHSGRDGIMHKINGRWLLRSSHIITIRQDYLTDPGLINTIRHEICHVLERNHRSRFKQLMRLLNENKTPEAESLVSNEATLSLA